MYFGHLQYRRTRSSRSNQRGYMLVILIFMMVGLVIAATAMAPAVATAIHRDKEVEMIHRGAQYARAIKRYYKKFGRYPATIEQLEDTNHMRFLRKRYKDPFTEDGQWELVKFGQVQMGAANRAGGGGFTAGGANLPNVPGVTGLLQGQNQQGTQPTFGGAPGVPGSGAVTTGPGSGQQFGGGAIIGVASKSDRESLRVVDDKNHYKDWKFIYDPTFDRGGLIKGPYDPKKQLGKFPGASNPGQQIGQPIGQPIGGQQPGSSGFGQPNQNQQLQPYHPPDQNVPPPNPQ